MYQFSRKYLNVWVFKVQYLSDSYWQMTISGQGPFLATALLHYFINTLDKIMYEKWHNNALQEMLLGKSWSAHQYG